MKSSKIKLFLFIIISTILLSIPRFGHLTPDSIYYVELANFFKGSFSIFDLQTPYAYRLLVPLISSFIPIENSIISITLVNLFFTCGAYIVFYYFLTEIFINYKDVLFGIFLLIFSFPTINYSSAVLTDAAGFFFIILSTLLLFREKFLWFSFSTSLGVLAREAVLFIDFAFILYLLGNLVFNKRKYIKHLYYSIPPIFVYLLVRLYFSFLPNYFWEISFENLTNNITRPISWLTSILTIFPIILIIIYGWNKKKLVINELISLRLQQRILIFSISTSCIILFVYSMLSAYMSGRFIWPFYSVLIPITVFFGKDSIFYKKWINPIYCLIFHNN